MRLFHVSLLISFAGVAAAPANARAAAIVRSSSGTNAAAIQATVDQFRTDVSLGGANNGNGGVFASGRREINWDGGANSNVTTALGPNAFIARGALYSTPGTGFIQSARIPGDDANTALRFGDITPSYNTTFTTFSAQKLFVAGGSTITDVRFFLPSAQAIPATVFGFGAVFTDVDRAATTRLEFYNAADSLIGSFNAPVANGGLSFVGVFFDAGERVGRVRLIAGDTALGAGVLDDATHDLVAIDDFVYSEPLPSPGAMALAGIAGVVGLRRRRR